MESARVPHPGWLLAVLLAGPLMAQADATIANVATPSIHTGLGASGAALELVIGGYLIAFAVVLITGARLGQTYGYRRVFVAGVGLFTAASLLCGLAPTPVVLVVARATQGLGAALMFPQTLTGIQLNFGGRQRARAIGLYALALSAGAVTGQILGGALISADLAGSGWRAVFLVNVPVGVLTTVAALRFLPPDARRRPRRLDLPGVAALSAAMMLVVVPLAVGRGQGWPAWTWLCLAAGVAAAAGFLAIERRVAARGGNPLVNMAVLARPAVCWALLALLAATGTYYALLFTLAQYLQQGLERSPLLSGLTLLPWVAAFGLAGQLVRWLPARIAPAVPVAGCLLLAAAYAAISAALFTGHRGEQVLAVALGLGGLGLGIQFNALIAHLTTVVPVGYAPDISGVSTTTMQIGAAVAVAAFGTLYFSGSARPGAGHATHAFALTTAALAIIALLAGLAARQAARPRARTEAEAGTEMPALARR